MNFLNKSPLRESSYFALCELKAAGLDKGSVVDFLIVGRPAADVGAWVVQTEAGALQGREDGVSHGRMAGFWVVIMGFIHPALKRKKHLI